MSPNQLAHREYLNSATWKDIREQVLQRDNHRCKRCGQPGWQVHHKTYKHWGYERLYELETLCDACHEAHHQAEKALKAKKNNKSGAIGTRALWGYLKSNQKEILIKQFQLKDEIQLHNKIYVLENEKVVRAACKLLGFKHFYSQKHKSFEQKEREKQNTKSKQQIHPRFQCLICSDYAANKVICPTHTQKFSDWLATELKYVNSFFDWIEQNYPMAVDCDNDIWKQGKITNLRARLPLAPKTEDNIDDFFSKLI